MTNHNCLENLEEHIEDIATSGVGNIDSDLYYECKVCGKRYSFFDVEKMEEEQLLKQNNQV